MEKSGAVIKTDKAENWLKAVNFVPDSFTIIVYEYNGKSPKVKIGDGVHKVNDLPFLSTPEVGEETLSL